MTESSQVQSAEIPGLQTWQIGQDPPPGVDMRARGSFTCPHRGEKLPMTAVFDRELYPNVGSLTLTLCDACRDSMGFSVNTAHLSLDEPDE